MNRLMILLAFLFTGNVLSSQAPFPEPEEVEAFYNTTTYIVLEDNMFSSYNALIKKAVAEYWELTDYDFISTAEFNEKRKDPACSFIVLTGTRFDKDNSGSVFNFINLLLGKDVGRIEYMPEFCAIPLSIQGAEDIGYSHKLGIIIRFMQAHVDHIKEDPSLKGKQYLKYYNKFIPEISSKKILVAATDLEPGLRSQEETDKYYPYDMEIVTDEEVDEAILSEAGNTLVLHKVGPESTGKGSLCFKMLLGTHGARMYFYGEHKISNRRPNGLLVNDLRRMARF